MSSNHSSAYNGDKDDDEAFRIAMALSLGKGAIDLTSADDSGPDEVEIVSPPVAAKRMPQTHDKQQDARPDMQATPPQKEAPKSASSLSILGLDRKKMEEERIARLNKRKASEALGVGSSTSTAAARAFQRPKLTEAMGGSALSITGLSPAKRPSNSHPVRVAGWKPLNLEGLKPMPPTLPYTSGAVKKTWVKGQPRTGDDVKIEELLQKEQLELAVFSSFQWDEEWLLTKVDMSRTRMIFVCYANDKAHQDQMRANVPSSRIRFCFPPMNGPGAMHSKLQLLKYEHYLRIVIPTANLVPYDWGETGVMENMVFVIDVPRLKTDQARDANKLTPFAEELMYFLEAQHLDDKLIKSLRNYDFSETARYGFVHSIAGSHTSGTWEKTGYCGLGRAVSALKLGCSGPIEMDYVCASLGAVTYDLLRALYFAFQGDSGLREYDCRTGVGKAKQTAMAGGEVDTLKHHIRVYFPSLQTVLQSIGGKNSAGTICVAKRWWDAESFPKEVLRDAKSVRKGVLMHSKVIFIRGPSNSGFAYVGSANLSESAWGRLVKDRGTKEPKLTCRNWECGVLVPTTADSSDENVASSANLEVFSGVVPVPMEFPSPSLASEASGPWFYRDS